MMAVVKDAFRLEKENQLAHGGLCNSKIDGMSGFIFQNRYGDPLNPQSVNRTIKRIVNDYNCEESLEAAKEKREAILLPMFSCHHCRHTFATRLSEVEENPKVIQSVMGHKEVATTYEIYADSSDRKNRESLNKLATKLDDVF
jgi:integrase